MNSVDVFLRLCEVPVDGEKSYSPGASGSRSFPHISAG